MSGRCERTPAAATRRGTSGSGPRSRSGTKSQLLGRRVVPAELEADLQDQGVAEEKTERHEGIDVPLVGHQQGDRYRDGEVRDGGDARDRSLAPVHPIRTSLTSLANESLRQKHHRHRRSDSLKLVTRAGIAWVSRAKLHRNLQALDETGRKLQGFPARLQVCTADCSRSINSDGHEGCRYPGAVSVVLRGARAQAHALRIARAELLRPDGPAHDGRHAAVQALLPRRGDPAREAADELPEVLPHDRHRERGHDAPPPDLLRDARQLLDWGLLQAGRGRVRARAVDEGVRLLAGGHLDQRLRGRQGTRARARRGGDRVLALGRHPRGAHRPARPRGQLLAVGTDRSLRALLRALPRPRPRLRPGCGPPRRRHRALPRVLEPRVHAVRAPGGRRAARAALAEHRHRHGTRPHGGSPPGGRVGLRDRPLPPADRAGGGALRPELRRGLPDHAGAADPRRPRTRRDLPVGGRRGPVERGPRLHPAPDHAARDPAGPRARHRRPVRGAAVRARDRGYGRALPGPEGRVADHRALGARGGGELRPHARAGRAVARGARRARQGGQHVVGRGRRRVQAARHLRLPLRDDQGAARRGGPLGRRPGLRGADGARPRGLAQRDGSRGRRRRPARAARGRAPLREGRGLPDALHRL